MRTTLRPILIVILCVGTVSATIGGTGQTASADAASAPGTFITVTGCLTSLSKAVGGHGHANAFSHVTEYVLTLPSSGNSNTSCAAGGCWLDATDSLVVSYVGTTVEVQGRFTGNRPVGTDDAQAIMSPTKLDFRQVSRKLPDLPVIKVESIRQVTSRCA